MLERDDDGSAQADLSLSTRFETATEITRYASDSQIVGSILGFFPIFGAFFVDKPVWEECDSGRPKSCLIRWFSESFPGLDSSIFFSVCCRRVAGI
jgi:hypothetical protein